MERPAEPDGIKPGKDDRPLLSMIVTCPVCVVAWDLDFDPAECTDPDHEHALTWEPAT